jgi:2-polyprenyl-3-methyl-5-hydroxy-6-metoxy-1,4-benzoquinol methylase
VTHRCAICEGHCRLRLEGLYDDRYGYSGYFDLLECEHCGHRQLRAKFSNAELAALYSTYYPRRSFEPATFAAHREVAGLRAWLDGSASSAFRWVPPGVRVLDIGSGIGQALAYHRARGCDAWGVEADENARAMAEREGLQVRIGAFDPAMFEPSSFDYVTMDQVIEHAADPIQFMRGAASLLRRGGHLVLSTPNSRGLGAKLFARRWINWHVPYHLQQFSRGSLARLARDAGLEIARLRTLTVSSWLHYQWLHLAAVPPPGQASAFWDPTRSGRSLPSGPRRAATLAHVLRLNHLATRVADALGIGDNFLCIMRKPS